MFSSPCSIYTSKHKWSHVHLPEGLTPGLPFTLALYMHKNVNLWTMDVIVAFNSSARVSIVVCGLQNNTTQLIYLNIVILNVLGLVHFSIFVRFAYNRILSQDILMSL